MTEPDTEARDVLAEVLAREMGVTVYGSADRVLAALAARGYRLTPEPAPDVEETAG